MSDNGVKEQLWRQYDLDPLGVGILLGFGLMLSILGLWWLVLFVVSLL